MTVNMNSHVWTLRNAGVSVSLGSPLTVIQYAAGTNTPAEVLGFSVTQNASTTSAMEQVRAAQINSAGTGFVAGLVGTNIFRWGSPDDNLYARLGTALTGIGVSPAEPSYGDIPRELDFNVLNGYENWYPVPYFIPPGGLFGVRLAGIVAGVWDVELFIHEFA